LRTLFQFISCNETRIQSALREQTPQERDRRYRSGIERYLIDLREITAMGEHDTVNWPIGSDRDVVDDPIDRIAQEFEARDEGKTDITTRELRAQRRRLIERNLSRPTANQRPSVEIFDAADAQGFQSE
jgi:hypothetical protein